MPVTNAIKKIILDFEYKDKTGDSFLTPAETSAYFYDVLLPVISELIEQNAPAENITIERLEIDLGTASMADFPRLVEEELARLLNACLPQNTAGKNGVNNTSAQTISRLSNLVYFLTYGVYPWHVGVEEADINTLFAALLKENKPLLTAALIKLFIFTPVALQRFVWQLQPRQQKAAIIFLTDGNRYAGVLLQWYEFVHSRKPALVNDALVSLYQFTVTAAGNTDEHVFFSAFATQILLPYFHLLPADVRPLMSLVVKERKRLSLNSQSKVVAHTGSAPNMFQPVAAWVFNHSQKKISNQQMDSKPANEISQPAKQNAENMRDALGDIYINNAGIVLLNPYLQMFFSRLGLLKENVFTGLPAQQKAVQVLHYLAAGNLETPEHLLPLCKVICGIDTHMPVPAKLRLSKQEKEDCEVLLQAVINNWPVIKNTSISGLRETFLMRNAVLRKDEQNWLLHVERKTVDVLIDQLPWQFGLLKFPWNEYFVHVQW